jgi:hypothetical protein
MAYECIAAAKDIVLAVAATTTAGAALWGLKNWNRELRGRASFEVAKGLAKATYKLRDALTQFRIPLVRAAEFPSDYPHEERKTTPHERANGYWHVFRNRWKDVNLAIQELDAQALEAEALWGAEIQKKAEALRACCWKLSAAFEAFVDNEASGGENFKEDREFGKNSKRGLCVTNGPGQSADR